MLIFRTVPTWQRGSWIAPLTVFACALLLFSLNLDRPPDPDELHHVLAAQHLLETGRPILADGEYSRGILHTWMVAISYQAFGEGLASARFPAVLLAALVAPALFLWVRREAGNTAAWPTALLYVTSPFTVEIAQFSRFYALQIFTFVLGSLCVYYAFARSASLLHRLCLGAMATSLIGLAISVQVTTLVGVVGIGTWGLSLLALRTFQDPTAHQTVRRYSAIALAVAGVFVIAAAVMTGAIEWAWERYQYVQLFNADKRNEFWFYYVRFLVLYPTLWTLVGFLALSAALLHARLAWFAICVFGVSFVLMSFAGTKATRYLSFASPFLAMVWGLGLAQIAPWVSRHAPAIRTRLSETLALPEQLKAVTAAALLALACIIILLTNPFWLRTATVIGNVNLPFERPATDWRAAREALAPWTASAEIMITTEELGAIYFLGRSDVRYSPSKLAEIPEDRRVEFGIDPRTGRPIIAKPESVRRLIDCFSSGLVVGPIEHWGSPILINDEVQSILVRHAKPIEVPRESHLYAWGWTRAPEEARPDHCADLIQFSGLRDHSGGR